MIRLCEYIRTSNATWNADYKIGTSITATTGTTMRIKYVGRNVGSDRVIGYAPQDGVSDSEDWRIFNGFSNTNTVDLNYSRKQGGTPTKQNGTEYDITLGNNFLYDNKSNTYIVSDGNVQSSLTNPFEIFVDVGSQDVMEVTIKDGETVLFDGKAAYDSESGNIGLYDSVSDSLKYNGNLTMTKGADLHTFNITPSTLEFQSAGGNDTFTVNAETGWTCTTPTGFTFSTTSGASGETVITVSADTYTGSTNKTETVVFTDDDGYTNSLEITQKKLILGYTFCEKIYNNGEAWIDTGIYPDSATTIDIVITNENIDIHGWYSPYVGNSDFCFAKYGGDTNFAIYKYGDGEIGESRTLYFNTGTTANINMSNTGLTMDFGDTTRVSAITMTTFTGTNETIKIGSEYCYATFGRCTIRKSGNIVADLFPCLLGNEVGYYDSVNQTFLGNSGSGSPFTAYDVYGNIVCGEDSVESLKLGSENVVIMYLGENPIYASYEPPFEGLAMTSTATLNRTTGSTATINIRSSENWTLSIPVDATWLSASTMSGLSGRTVVNLETVEENTASTRTATITATTANYSATCVVTQKYFVDNFMFNYNARNYDSLTNTITRESGQLFDEDIVVHPVSADTTKLTFNGSRNQRYAKQYSSSSANPFNRSSNDSELTFIYKANFTSTSSKASNLFANRNGGYNYMVRKDFFHASQAYLEIVPSEQPAIVYITVDSSGNGFKKIVTTNQTVSGSVVFNEQSNAITFFDGGWITYEEFIGDFYWMFCANRKLTDAEIQAVIDYNE